MFCRLSLLTNLVFYLFLSFFVQSAVGEVDCQQAAPLGAVDHIHRVDQESRVQILESRICALCSRNRETVRVGRQVMYGPETDAA